MHTVMLSHLHASWDLYLFLSFDSDWSSLQLGTTYFLLYCISFNDCLTSCSALRRWADSWDIYGQRCVQHVQQILFCNTGRQLFSVANFIGYGDEGTDELFLKADFRVGWLNYCCFFFSVKTKKKEKKIEWSLLQWWNLLQNEFSLNCDSKWLSSRI